MTSAKPLNLAISLNLPTSDSTTSSRLSTHSRVPASSPAPPLDWQQKWRRRFLHSDPSADSPARDDVDIESDSDSDSLSSSSTDPWQEEASSSSGRSRKRKWVTCITDWNQGNPSRPKCNGLPHISISSPPNQEPYSDSSSEANQAILSDDRKARLGGKAGRRIALGLADGTVWLLASRNSSQRSNGKARETASDWGTSSKTEQDRETRHKLVDGSQPRSTSISTSSSRGSRAQSPTPSTHSHRSARVSSHSSNSGHRRRQGESISISNHHPPFVGFGSPVSPTAPISSTSQPTNFNQIFSEVGNSRTSELTSPQASPVTTVAANASRDKPETSNVTAIAENNSGQNSKMKDAESQLEAQYHAGDKEREPAVENGSGVVGGMMQALGLGSSTHPHPHPHSHSHAYIAPSKHHATSPRRTSHFQHDISEPARLDPDPRVHSSVTGARDEIDKGSSFNTPPPMTRSGSETNSILGAFEETSDLIKFVPIFQFLTSDRSPVIGVCVLDPAAVKSDDEATRTRPEAEPEELKSNARANSNELEDDSLAEPSNMIILQESGTMSHWSLEDGTLISSLNLSTLDFSQSENSHDFASAANSLSVPAATPSQGALASTIAALRSTANGTPLGGRSRSGSDVKDQKDLKHQVKSVCFPSSANKSMSLATKFVSLQKIAMPRGEDQFPGETEYKALLLAYDSLNARVCLMSVVTTPRSEICPELIKSIRLSKIKHHQVPSCFFSSSSGDKLSLVIFYIDCFDCVKSITSSIPRQSVINSDSKLQSLQSSIPPASFNHSKPDSISQSLSASPQIKATSLAMDSSPSKPSTPSVASTDQRFDFHLPFRRNLPNDKQIPTLLSTSSETTQIKSVGQLREITGIKRSLGSEIDAENGLLWVWSASQLVVAALSEAGFQTLATTKLDLSNLLSVKSFGGAGRRAILQFTDHSRMGTLSPENSIIITALTENSAIDELCVSQQSGCHWVVCEAGELKIWHQAALKDIESSMVYSCSVISQSPKTAEQISIVSVLPLSMERMVLALSTGQLLSSSLLDLVSQRTYQKDIISSDSDSVSANSSRYKGTISLLQLATNVRTSSRHIVGGTEEGDVMIWDSATLTLQAEWSLFTSPVTTLVSIGPTDNAIRLHGTLLVISADGTVAIIVLDGLKLLSVVPGRGSGTGSRLEKIAVRVDDLLLIYDDGKGRVWDTRSQELRRSIGLDQATYLLEDGKGSWTQFEVDPTLSRREKGSNGVLSAIPSARAASAMTVLADMRRGIEAASKAVNSLISTGSTRTAPPTQSLSQADDSLAPPPPDAFMSIRNHSLNSSNRVKVSPAGAKKALTILKPLLSALLPACALTASSRDHMQKLTGADLNPPFPSFGTFSSPGFLARAVASTPSEIWSVSTALTTDLLLSVVSVLGVVSRIPEHENAATSLMSFLIINLPEVIGDSYQPPSLPALASYFMDSNGELQFVSFY